MAEPSISNRSGQRSPRDSELAAPRVEPRVRKIPTKHISTKKCSSIDVPFDEGSCLFDDTSVPHDPPFNGGDFSSLSLETSAPPQETGDSPVAVSEIDFEAPQQSSHSPLKEDASHTEDAWKQVQATSLGIKSRMLHSAKHAAEMKAAAAAAAAATEKKPEPQFGGVVEILTSGELCNATAEWLSPQNCARAPTSLDQQDDDIVVVSPPTASADPYTPSMQRSVATRMQKDDTDNSIYTSPTKTQYVVEGVTSDTHSISLEAESFEEVFSFDSTASSCSSSTGGALNSYAPMNSDKSAAETAATLQTLQEDEDVLQQHEKAAKRVLWKRLFRSKPQSTAAIPDSDDQSADIAIMEATLDENNPSCQTNPENRLLDDIIHLHLIEPTRDIHHQDDETDQDVTAAEETGIEAVLSSLSSTTRKPIEKSTADLSFTQLTSIVDHPYPEEEQPPSLGAVSSESSAGSKTSEDGTVSKKPSVQSQGTFLRRVLGGKGSPSKNKTRDDEIPSRKQSTLISF